MSLSKRKNLFINRSAFVGANTLIAVAIVFVFAACTSPVDDTLIVPEPEPINAPALVVNDEDDVIALGKVEANADWTIDQGWDAFYEPVLERYKLAHSQGLIDNDIAREAGQNLYVSGLYDAFQEKYELEKDSLGNGSVLYGSLYSSAYSDEYSFVDYAILDIDNNGMPELFIGMRDHCFCDIWTANDAYEPVFLFTVGSSMVGGSMYKGDDMNYILCLESDFGWVQGSVYHIASDGISVIEDIRFEGNDWGTRDTGNVGISKEEFSELFPGFTYYEPVYVIGDDEMSGEKFWNLKYFSGGRIDQGFEWKHIAGEYEG